MGPLRVPEIYHSGSVNCILKLHILTKALLVMCLTMLYVSEGANIGPEPYPSRVVSQSVRL